MIPLSKSEESLESVFSCLKGSDSAIRRVCASMGLDLKPKVLYRETDGRVMTMVDHLVDAHYVESFEDLMCQENSGFLVKSRGLKENGGGEFEIDFDKHFGEPPMYEYKEVWWLMKRTELTREKTDFVAYGNEAELAHTYGDVVLVASVGGHGNRQLIVKLDDLRSTDGFEAKMSS